MKNLKKVFALVLSLAMIVSTFTVSFAAEDTKTDADICEALELIKGDGDGVTEEYLGTESPRWKLALMSLRLRGLEDEALAFEGTETFADAEEMTWVGGRPALAYLKANPELGWLGRGEEFDPNGMMTVQEYYKVMLETLGYTQGEDFEWEDVMTFAEEKNLVAAADAEKLTMADVAAVTVEVLKAENSEGVILADALVEAGAIDQDLAVELDLVDPPVVAVLESVVSIDNNRVHANYDIELAAAPEVTIVDSKDKEVEVKDVVIKGKVVVVDTADMIPGTTYTVTVGDVTKTIVAKPADTTKPAVHSTLPVTSELVRVVFNSTDLDLATIVEEDFTINNDLIATGVVVDEAYNKNNAGKTAVLLSTSAQKAGKLYTITINNVADNAGNLIKANTTVKFAGKAVDKTGPAIKSVVSKDGNTISIKFTESSKLNEDTALDVSNYSVEGLTITNATLVKGSNEYTADPEVILDTDTQKAGKLYTLSIGTGLLDEFGNAPKQTLTKKFAGTPLDTTKLGFETVLATNNDKVKVTFNDKTDESALDIANYSIDNNLSVVEAEYLVESDGTNNTKVVYLTTSEQVQGKLYTLTVTNILDKAGNGFVSTNTKKFAGVKKDTTPPTATIKSANAGTVVVQFSEDLDADTASNVLNYKFDNDLGYATSAVYDKATNKVTLTTAAQTAGKMYKLTIDGVMDVNGNIATGSKKIEKTFAGTASSTKLQVSSAVSVDRSTFKIMFNQPVRALVAQNLFVINESQSSSQTNDITANHSGTSAPVALSSIASDVNVTLNSEGTEATVTFKPARYMRASDLYKIDVKSVTSYPAVGKFGAVLDTDNNSAYFGGIATEKKVSVDTVEVIDSKNIKLVFNCNISLLDGTLDGDDIKITLDGDTTPLADNTTVTAVDNKLSVSLSAGVFEANKVYNVEFNDTNKDITDASGFFVVNNEDGADAVFATSNLPEVKLAVDTATQKDSNVIDVMFNYPVNVASISAANVKVLVDDASTPVSGLTVQKVEIDSKDNKLVHIYTNKDLSGANSNVYYVDFTTEDANVKYVHDTNITLDNNSSSDAKKGTFAKSIADDDTPEIDSVVPVDSDTFKVTFKEGLKAGGSGITTAIEVLENKDFVVKDANGNVVPVTVTLDAAGATAPQTDTDNAGTYNTGYFKSLYFTVDGAFAAGKTYTFNTGSSIADITDLEGNVLVAPSAAISFTGLDTGDTMATDPVKDATDGLVWNTDKVTTGSNSSAATETLRYEYVLATSAPASDVTPAETTSYLVKGNTGDLLTGITIGGNNVYVRAIDVAGNVSAWVQVN